MLSEDVASPSLDLLREHLRAVMPEARWYTYQAISPANARAGATLAFGSPVVPRCQIDRAEVVLALDCDFLGLEEEGGRHLLGFAQARRLEAPSDSMNRLYVVESRFSLTGGHGRSPAPAPGEPRPRLHPGPARDGARWLDARTSRCDKPSRRRALGKEGPAITIAGPWIEEVAADLKAHAGRAVILAGRRQPPLVHALVHAMNAALGNLGKTVELRNGPSSTGAGTLAELAEAAGKGQVETLVILGGNPAYDAPADLEFAALMKRVEDHDPAGIARRRDFARGHLAPARRALPRVVGRCPHRRRDGRADPAPDRAARRRADGARGGRPTGRLSRRRRPTRSSAARFRKVSGVAEAGFEAAWRSFLHDGLLPRLGVPGRDTGIEVGFDRQGGGRRAAGSRSAVGRSPRARSWTATPRSTTAGSPTTAGCKRSPTRSPS